MVSILESGDLPHTIILIAAFSVIPASILTLALGNPSHPRARNPVMVFVSTFGVAFILLSVGLGSATLNHNRDTKNDARATRTDALVIATKALQRAGYKDFSLSWQSYEDSSSAPLSPGDSQWSTIPTGATLRFGGEEASRYVLLMHIKMPSCTMVLPLRQDPFSSGKPIINIYPYVSQGSTTHFLSPESVYLPANKADCRINQFADPAVVPAME